MTYLSYLLSNWEAFFHLTSFTKIPELLALKAFGYLSINREDLARKTIEEMRVADDENCLTILAEAAVRIMSEGEMEGVKERIMETGDKNEYTTKLYNLLSLALVRDGKISSGEKVLKKALAESKLLTREDKTMTKDEESFVSNYLRYCPRDEDHQTLSGLLNKSNSYWT